MHVSCMTQETDIQCVRVCVDIKFPCLFIFSFLGLFMALVTEVTCAVAN